MRSAVPPGFYCSFFPAFLVGTVGRGNLSSSSVQLQVHHAAAVTSKSQGDKSGENNTGKGPGSELQVCYTAAYVGWGFILD